MVSFYHGFSPIESLLHGDAVNRNTENLNALHTQLTFSIRMVKSLARFDSFLAVSFVEMVQSRHNGPRGKFAVDLALGSKTHAASYFRTY